MMKEVSRKTSIFNFINTEIEVKIKECLTKFNQSKNKLLRDNWKKNTEKNGTKQHKSIMIWTDLLKNHRITHNKIEVKTIYLIYRDIIIKLKISTFLRGGEEIMLFHLIKSKKKCKDILPLTFIQGKKK